MIKKGFTNFIVMICASIAFGAWLNNINAGLFMFWILSLLTVD